MRIRPKKRIVREKPEPLTVPEAINQEGLAIEVDFSLPAERVIRAAAGHRVAG